MMQRCGARSHATGVGRSVSLGCVLEQRIGRTSARTSEVGVRFGLPMFGSRETVIENTRIRLGPGRIVLLVGPSGTGKTTALGRIEAQFAGGCMVQRVRFPPDAAIIDGVASWAPLKEALEILTSCGLAEAHLWLRRFDGLSEGERFRAQLARAVALHGRSGGVTPLLCDEFCSSLHRRAAKAICHNLHKLVARRNLSVVLACSHEDVIADLKPHCIVRVLGRGRCELVHADPKTGAPVSFRRRLRIGPGRKCDYEAFSAMHYRASDELGFVDKVFVMRDGEGGEPLGIVVYSHGPLELSLRNQATDGRFRRNAKRLNRSMRILRRLVIHPDVRGCGLGHYLVRKTLPLVGTEYVECLAGMGAFNPVFERAGMERIGQYAVSAPCRAALESLRAMDIDPNSREFPMQVCRRRRVRAIVSRTVHDWYAATTAGGECRVEKQSPQLLAQTFRGLIGSQPVYYLWRRPRPHRPVGTRKKAGVNRDA